MAMLPASCSSPHARRPPEATRVQLASGHLVHDRLPFLASPRWRQCWRGRETCPSLLAGKRCSHLSVLTVEFRRASLLAGLPSLISSRGRARPVLTARGRGPPLLYVRFIEARGGCPIYNMSSFMAQEVARGRSRARWPVLGGGVGAREKGRDWGGRLARDGAGVDHRPGAGWAAMVGRRPQFFYLYFLFFNWLTSGPFVHVSVSIAFFATSILQMVHMSESLSISRKSTISANCKQF
jgi:hypothetical protein